jgi:hypothetical protein
MARRRKRSRFHFEELEGQLERPDPTAEKAQAEEEKTQDGHPGAEHGASGPHAQLLELQKTAGNRAVGAVLDRLAHDATHAAPAGGGGWPKEKQIIFDGSGVPLESVNLGAVGAARPGSGSRTPKPDEFGGPGEISVVLPAGGWLNDISRAFEHGEVYKTVEIVVPGAGGGGLRLILTAVELSGFASSGGGDHPLATVTLKFQKRTLSQQPPG